MMYRSGDRLCNCTLLQKCGSGAYGEVWLAEDAIGTRVALKIIANRGSCSERELAGLRNYKECNHPNLLKIRYVEVSDERICYTMDAADDLTRGAGGYLPDTLANRLQRFGRLDGKAITSMLDGLLAGLEELHRRNLVHRDIKPDNILWVNGRPTLADAGLIAPDGQGSLVGTPGFLSPKLMAGRGAADASDDFYALGKVIYCALTGLPVREYPGLPADLTISVDAGLNRALRESCTHPVRSTAEFRRLLHEARAGKVENEAPARNDGPARISRRWIVAGAIIVLFLLLGGFWWWGGLRGRQNGMELRQIPAAPAAALPVAAAAIPVEKLEPEQRKPAQGKQTPDSAFQQELRKQIEDQFREFGFFSDGGRLVPGMLNFQPMTGATVCELILRDTADPRLRRVAGALPRRAKTPSQLETALAELFQTLYPDYEPTEVTRRQQYWGNAPGSNAEKQKKMLMEDSVMQAVVLDEVIRNGVNAILRNGAVNPQDVEKLAKLLLLRYGLLNPEKAEVIWREAQERKNSFF